MGKTSTMMVVSTREALRVEIEPDLLTPRCGKVKLGWLFRYKIRRTLMLGALFAVSLLHSIRKSVSFNYTGVRRLEGLFNEPSIGVINLSIQHVEPISEVSAAVCFKTLFGDIVLGIVIQWAGMSIIVHVVLARSTP